jgi:hypothetical protein
MSPWRIGAVGAVLVGAVCAPVVTLADETCEATLIRFVSELDVMLNENAHRDALQALLSRVFPVKKCDLERATAIARQSRYFDHASPNGPTTVVVLSNGKQHGRRGSRVMFGLRPNGDSYLPAVTPTDYSP